MSGLAALFSRDGHPVDREEVGDMLQAIPYRGPDGMWVRTFPPVALGYAKLGITPEEAAEVQPLVSPRTGCVIVADVRLDNRAELLAALPEAPDAAASDGELLLRAYEAWGPDAASRLLGDFAFILWDPRCQRLACARDGSGQRTLFYRADGRTFAAASEIHQLFQDSTVAIEANDARVREFLVPFNAFQNMKDSRETFYRHIFSLAPGHLLLIDRQNLRIQRYWELKPPPEIRYPSSEEYSEHFRQLFFRAVGDRLRSTHCTSAMLSGGLDSSSVVCAAHQLYKTGEVPHRGFQSLSMVFEGLECDESALIHDIQTQYGFQAEYLPVADGQWWLNLAPPGFQEAPSVGVSDGRDLLWQSAVNGGARTILTGDVADGCIYGSRLVFDSLLRQGKLGEFRRHFRQFRQGTTEPMWKSLLLGCAAPLLPLSLSRQLRLRLLERQARRGPKRLPLPWVPERLGEELIRRNNELLVEAERNRRFSSPARHAEYLQLCPPETFRHPAGWPLEIWRPFADRRLLEFLFAIPPELKFSPHPETDEFYAGSKRLLRDAMRGVLPESVRTRKSKTIFSSAITDVIARSWPSYEAAFGPGSQSEVADRGYIDPGRFWERLQLLRNGESVPEIIYLFHVIALETWFRTLRAPRSKLTRVHSPWQQSSPQLH
ncbi:MAG: asparagine synthase-related protein [Actinomycetota bacterium]